MKKSKVTTKRTKSKVSTTRTKRTSNAGHYVVEHDFIIIVGGGLIVLMLTVFLFLFQ